MQIWGGKIQVKKSRKNWIWEGLGLHLGGFGDGFGRHLEALGASWVVFGGHFLMLVFGMVFKSALGGLWARFWIDVRGLGVDFGSILRGLGEVWGEFGEDFVGF